MRLPVDVDPSPSVGDNADMGSVDVIVFMDEVVSEGRAEELRGRNVMLLGDDVDCVFY